MPDNTSIGRTVVGHRIEGLLGEGGMGVVYRARHEHLGRVRALKLLPPQLTDDESFRERFEREWRLAAAIEHPNIVEVLDAGEADGQLYIVMRLIEGPDLARLVANKVPLEPAKTRALCQGEIDGRPFRRGTTAVSGSTVTCSFPVPARAAGQPFLVRISVRTSQGSRLVTARGRVASASSPPPPQPPTPQPPAPQPPPPPPTQTSPVPQ